MEIGIPKEIKDQEFRVGLTPASVRVCTEAGHQVFIETGAGLGAGFSDEDYIQAKAKILQNAGEVWNCEMIVKVKEPLSSEYQFLKSGQILFTYLHLAADRKLTERLIESGAVAIAYET
ncbi:MAG: alanine dehydrogenase, partial [Okeania sp. SIO2H7]|nr:alanine dehydrogenase [Okeania sp. SIO2H7]